MSNANVIGTDTLLQMAKQLLSRGEITEEQYSQMEKRKSIVEPDWRKDVVLLGGN